MCIQNAPSTLKGCIVSIYGTQASWGNPGTHIRTAQNSPHAGHGQGDIPPLFQCGRNLHPLCPGCAASPGLKSSHRKQKAEKDTKRCTSYFQTKMLIAPKFIYHEKMENICLRW